MFEVVQEMLSIPIVNRAIIVGTLIALCAALLGVSLVLKRYSMIGDGLSHVSFSAMALATALNAQPMYVSIPIVVVAAFLLLKISENSRIKGDAAIALISTSALAIGVMIVSISTGMNVDVCNYLFGSIFTITKQDLRLSVIICSVIIVMFIILYNRIFAVTFDEAFAKATGSKVSIYNTLIAILTAFIIVLGMRMMGSLLISSLIIFPALSSMRVHKKFKTVIISSAIISVLCLWIGMYISYNYSTPGGASIVICNLLVFVVYSLIAIVKERAV